MKLVRFGPPGEERPGIWLEEPDGSAFVIDVNRVAFDIHDYDSHFFSRWGLQRLEGIVQENPAARLPAADVRLGPPIPPPANLICVGLNYHSHARELGLESPAEPLLFAKAPTSITGPTDPVRVPADAEVDFEVELAVIIGEAASNVSAAEALSCVAGYTILDDITDRRAQDRFSQWYLAKSRPTFCPLGPWLVTRDEIPYPPRLRMKSFLNGVPVQDGSTEDMIFPLDEVISYVSRHIALQPGDVIATGTPAGIGSRRSPPLLLKPGDRIELEIEQLGRQSNPVMASD